MRYFFYLTLLLYPFSVLAQAEYTDDMYKRGLAKQSTAPLFVLVTIADPKTGSARTACVDAPFLLGAIHMEYNLPYDEAGESAALAIASNQPGRRFSFKKEEAQKNIEISYREELGEFMREKLSPMSDKQLREGLDTFNGEIHHLYRPKGTYMADSAALHAVCQVFLERGILVGHTDLGYQLYLEELRPERIG